MHASKSRHLPRLIVSIAVILSGFAGIAPIMGWLSAATDGSSDILALNFPVAAAIPVSVTTQTLPAKAERTARAKGRCAECGTIVSMREIDAPDEGAGFDASGAAAAGNQDELQVTSARRYELTIRLADGSSRVIRDANSANWRAGERLIVIDGANPARR